VHMSPFFWPITIVWRALSKPPVRHLL
jgi:hypothetical protein